MPNSIHVLLGAHIGAKLFDLSLIYHTTFGVLSLLCRISKMYLSCYNLTKNDLNFNDEKFETWLLASKSLLSSYSIEVTQSFRCSNVNFII